MAFAYLRQAVDPAGETARRLADLAVGETRRVELSGGVFALEQAYQSKPRAEGFFESHRAYVDLQAIVAGEELMEVTDIARLTVREDRTPGQDVLIYEDFAAGSVWRVGAGEVAVFFPNDAHMPSLAIGAPSVVRKTVVKVPVDA